jgi:beta-lactamase regulating signal transducer with metallopeptidase domain/thiol-disulfide isomerase/thioredoxin/uncharacterized GH25 family protein
MNSLQALIDSPVIERLGWTLLHSVWQGLAVAIALALLLPATRRRGARLAYATCLGALVLVALLPAATFCVIPQGPRTPTPFTSDLPRTTEGPQAERRTAARPMLPLGIDPMEAATKHPVDSSVAVPSSNVAPRLASTDEPPTDRPSARVSKTSVSLAEASTTASPTRPAVSWRDRAGLLGSQLREGLAQWLPWTVLAWSAGVLALSLWNLGGWFAVQRLKLSGTRSVPLPIEQAAASVAARLGVARRVRLLQSILVQSPVVIGVIKPAILLPASLITQIPADQLESLLAHELAHVLRHDYLINLLQGVIETLLFYHPAIWWISAQVRAERENCCDDMAIGVTSDRAVYVRALATVAGARPSQMVPAATGGRLIARLRRILGLVDPVAAHPSRWLTGVVILSLCGAAIMFLAIGSRPAKAQVSAPAAQTKPESKSPQSKAAQLPKANPRPANAVEHRGLRSHGHMRIEVLDEAGHPLPDAVVRVELTTPDDLVEKQTYDCDAQGRTTVDLPETVPGLAVYASETGFCTERKWFWPKNKSDHTLIPDDFQFRLVRPVPLGGVVRDEHGRVVAGAQLQFFDSGSYAHFEASTDARGVWHLEGRPNQRMALNRVTHPDYLANNRWERSAPGQDVAFEALRTQNGVVVMRRGLPVTGKVVDPAGKPIPNAVVSWGHGAQPGAEDRCRTDEGGRFRLQVATTGPQKIAVLAKGWMPDQKAIVVSGTTPPVDFQLKPGKKLRLRIVDRSGVPVPGVLTTVDVWRGAYLINNRPNYVGDDVDIPCRTDKNGRLEWNWAPDDPVGFNLAKSGYAASEVTVTADGREQTRTINPLLHIAGTVLDAKTGRPIDKFDVIPIDYFNRDLLSVLRGDGWADGTGAVQHFAGGRFDAECSRGDVEHCVQIEAPGYKTFRDPHRYRIGDANPELTVRLEPCDRYRGRVVDSSGHPVSDARILIRTWSEGGLSMDLLSVTEQRADLYFKIRVDNNGVFEIPAPIETYVLQVVSPNGYAEIERAPTERPGEIRIKPWARVTGRLVQSGEPIANASITIDPIRIRAVGLPRVFTTRNGTTKADGSFVFERVPPIPSRISAQLHFSVASPLKSSQSVPLQLKPGETVDVTLGGDGTEITGQFVAENQPDNFDYHFGLNYLVARRPGIDPPKSLAGKEFDWHKGWSDAWRGSPEGQTYLNTLEHWFVKAEPDGHFHISGVLPGHYDLGVALYGATEGCLVHPLSSGVVHIFVKPGQKQLDLRKLYIPSLTPPKVGEPASTFVFKTLDAEKTSSVLFRGNYVLIDFWATWCGPCVAKLDEVERLRKQFAGERPLVVIGANLDSDRDRASKFLKEKPLLWQHALLGDWADTDVPLRYAVSSVPAYVLIDPDGRLLAQENSLDVIEAKLKASSAKPPRVAK